MNLTEFLKTASNDDSIALTEAKAYTESQEKLISSGAMAMILVDFKLYDTFKASTEEAIHAFMDRVMTNSEFNFYEPSRAGAANFALLDVLINDPILRATLTSLGQTETNPFSNITLYDVKRTRDTAIKKSVTLVDGFLVLEVLTDCEKHNTDILVLNPRTNKHIQIGSFRDVSIAGKYDMKIPVEYRANDLFVMDAYSVFS